MTLTYSTKANNTIWFKIIPASKNVYLSGSLGYCMWDQTKTVTTKDKLPAGTYYVQVYKYKGDDWMSGYYTLKWKVKIRRSETCLQIFTHLNEPLAKNSQFLI